MDADVVVVGAGISGLSAARLLDRNGLKVIVMEARDRVGGRTHAVRDPSFNYSDMGGAYVGPTQRRIARMATDLGLKFYKVFQDFKLKTVIRQKGKRIVYTGTVPAVSNPLELLDVNHFKRTIDRLATLVPEDAPWKAKKAAEWDSITLKQFADSICWTDFSRMMAAIFCQALFGSESDKVSLLAFLWYVHSGKGLDRLLNITNGAQERKIVGGSMRVSERIAEDFKGKLLFNSAVVSIEQPDGTGPTEQAGIKVTTSNGDVIAARYVIVALAPVLQTRIKFTPPMEPAKQRAVQQATIGSGIKVAVFYPRPFWRELGYTGETMSDSGPIVYCLDDTKPDGSHPAIVGFITIQYEEHYRKLSRAERIRVVTQQYAETFQCPDLLHPVDFVDKDWSQEEFSTGCVTYYPPGALLTKNLEALRQPHINTFFAGTETATCWVGYMDGAVQAGERAAREVLHRLGKLRAEEVWTEEPPRDDFPENLGESKFVENILPSVPVFLLGTSAVVVVALAWVARYFI